MATKSRKLSLGIFGILVVFISIILINSQLTQNPELERSEQIVEWANQVTTFKDSTGYIPTKVVAEKWTNEESLDGCGLIFDNYASALGTELKDSFDQRI